MAREESVKKTINYPYFGQTLSVDLGDEGSVRFRIGEFNVQIDNKAFQALVAEQKKARHGKG